MSDIIERECCARAALYDDLKSEIERLRGTLEAIEGWSRAYPLAVFPELLKAGGMTLDAISAGAMRHVITQVGKMARVALGVRTVETGDQEVRKR